VSYKALHYSSVSLIAYSAPHIVSTDLLNNHYTLVGRNMLFLYVIFLEFMYDLKNVTQEILHFLYRLFHFLIGMSIFRYPDTSGRIRISQHSSTTTGSRTMHFKPENGDKVPPINGS
jgi:hypothetical protein